MCYPALIVDYDGLLQVWIIDYHGLSWIIMDYLGLSLIIIDYELWWIIEDYHELWTIMEYHGFGAYHGLWTIMDYCGLMWYNVDYCGFLNMHDHGIARITRYAPQAPDDT